MEGFLQGARTCLPETGRCNGVLISLRPHVLKQCSVGHYREVQQCLPLHPSPLKARLKVLLSLQLAAAAPEPCTTPLHQSPALPPQRQRSALPLLHQRPALPQPLL
ncbi:UNVERIFIED_CONTAM: hypothetical protein FKN15_006318 [Acipenser sinensis]